MWTRELLKSNAKLALRQRYGAAILVSLLAGILTGRSSGLGSFSFRNGFSGSFRTDAGNFDNFKDFLMHSNGLLAAIIAVGAVAIPIAIFFGIAFNVFVASPILVGQDRFYLESRAGKSDVSKLFSAFGKGYMNVVKVMFFKNLYIFLWSLLFVIPGIIKAIEYIAVDYIMAENPDMDQNRAFEISRGMTAGEKWNIFVLYLSFIGWGILCVFTCFIGFLFLAPYIQATYAELYTALREKALSQNLAAPEELPGIAVNPPPPVAPGPWNPVQ